MWTVKWWKDVGERAIRTFAAALVGWVSVAGTVVGFEDLNWLRGISLAGVATLVTVLLSISTHGITGNGPSFNSVYKNKETGENAGDSDSNSADDSRRVS